MFGLSTEFTEFRVRVVWNVSRCAVVRSTACQRLPTMSTPPSRIRGRPSSLPFARFVPSQSGVRRPSSHTRTWRVTVRSGEPNATRALSPSAMRYRRQPLSTATFELPAKSRWTFVTTYCSAVSARSMVYS